MRYIEFREKIRSELGKSSAGLTWMELKARLGLPYKTPCPQWMKQMQNEIGLSRSRRSGRALVWTIKKKKPAAKPSR